MLWVDDENSRLVKAWEGCAGGIKAADVEVSLSPNGNYWIMTRTGNVLQLPMLIPTRMRGLADNIAGYISENNWQQFSMDEAADCLIDVLETGIPRESRWALDEMEVILVQRISSVIDECPYSIRISQNKEFTPA